MLRRVEFANFQFFNTILPMENFSQKNEFYKLQTFTTFEPKKIF